VKSIATTVFLARHYSMVATACLQARNTGIVTGGKLPWSWRARQPTQLSKCSDLSWHHGGKHAIPSKKHSRPSVLWCCWLSNRKGIRPLDILRNSSQEFPLGDRPNAE